MTKIEKIIHIFKIENGDPDELESVETLSSIITTLRKLEVPEEQIENYRERVIQVYRAVFEETAKFFAEQLSDEDVDTLYNFFISDAYNNYLKVRDRFANELEEIKQRGMLQLRPIMNEIAGVIFTYGSKKAFGNCEQYEDSSTYSNEAQKPNPFKLKDDESIC